MNLALSLPVLAATVAWAAPVSRSYELSGFTGVAASGGMQLELESGPFSVSVEGEPKDLDALTVEVKGGTVVFKPGLSLLRSGKGLKARVRLPALSSIEASGGMAVKLAAFEGTALSLKLSRGVSLEAPTLVYDAFDVHASGGVSLALGGAVKVASLEVSGGGSVKGKSLQIQRGAIDASGGVGMELSVSDVLAGKASGGCTVKVWGKPRVQVETSGASSVKQMES